MPISYPRQKPCERDQQSTFNSRQQLLPSQDGVQSWHVAVVVALLVAILVAILILVPLYTVHSSDSRNSKDSQHDKEDGEKSDDKDDMETKNETDVDVDVTDEIKFLANKTVLNLTEELALEMINDLARYGKVKINPRFNASSGKVNVSSANNLTCSAQGITCARKLDMKEDGDFYVGNLSVGSRIAIRGRVKPNPVSFTIDLLMENGKALHLNPRLNYYGQTNVFVRNSLLGNTWGAEEKTVETFPFTAGQFFEVIILGETNQFNLTANGVRLSYAYRKGVTIANITHVSFSGDVVPIDVMQM